MKNSTTELLKKTTDPLIKEHLDAYVLVGYTADRHRRVVVCAFGNDASCHDGLQIMAAAAERWREGGLNRPHGSDGQMRIKKD